MVKYRTLGQALKVAFPEIEWDEARFSQKGKKSIQGWYVRRGRKMKGMKRKMKREGRKRKRKG